MDQVAFDFDVVETAVAFVTANMAAEIACRLLRIGQVVCFDRSVYGPLGRIGAERVTGVIVDTLADRIDVRLPGGALYRCCANSVVLGCRL